MTTTTGTTPPAVLADAEQTITPPAEIPELDDLIEDEQPTTAPTTRTATSTANGNKAVPSLIKGMRVKLREALGLTQDDAHPSDTVAPNGNDPQSANITEPRRSRLRRPRIANAI